MPQFMLVPKSVDLKKPTVADLIDALKQFPLYYRVDFSPGDCDDITENASVELLEGSTSDGPGTVWIKLVDDGCSDLDGPMSSLADPNKDI